MRIEANLFCGGAQRALTVSYDDGREFDRRLVSIFDEYSIRGTFHLNSGKLGTPGYIAADEVPQLYAKHEISAHGETHPFYTDLPDAGILADITADKRALEGVGGRIVRGMSYPFGDVDDRVVRILRTAGMEYSRTVASTGHFGLPADFMYWNPTCHHRGAAGKTASELLDAFFAPQRYNRPMLFYMWGHSFEFDGANNWDLIEEFCKKAAGRDGVWYATNIEIVDYINAVCALRYSADMKIIFNPSALDVWVSADGAPLKIGAGETVRL
jgi:hypothetical protein